MTILITDRIVIRHIEPRDFENIFALFTDPDVMQYFDRVRDRVQTQTWMDSVYRSYEVHGFGIWTLEHVEHGTFIGIAGLIDRSWDDRSDIEVGYMLARSQWNQGYATEAARVCRDYAFAHHHPDRVVSFIDSRNDQSKAVAARAGMRLLKQRFIAASNQLLDVWGVYAGDAR